MTDFLFAAFGGGSLVALAILMARWWRSRWWAQMAATVRKPSEGKPSSEQE
jgi:hypothetical protein